MPQIGEWFEGRGFLLAGVILAPIAVIVAFVSAGFGHGTTYGRVSSFRWHAFLLQQEMSIWVDCSLSVPLAVLQYPLYGYWLDRASRRLVTCCVIIAMHAALVAWLFFGNTDFRYYNKY